MRMLQNPKTKVKLESVSCPMGCFKSDRLLFSGRDRLNNLDGEFQVVQCRTCGLMRTNPRPTAESIRYYYPDSYGPYRGTEIEIAPEAENLLNRIARLLKKGIQLNANRIPDMQIGRMLEIGCASGAFLHKLKQFGWEVEGIELSTHACQQARKHGYKVFNGPVESAPHPEKLYDLIVGWMVLEHLHDPVKALTRMHDWSSESALLVLSVPNAGSLEFKIFNELWYALQVPSHLFHFTPLTLKKLLGKCGWQIQRVLHQRTLSNLIASIGYFLQDRHLLPRAASFMTRYPEARPSVHALLYPLAWALSAFGQTGRMTIWAKKVG